MIRLKKILQTAHLNKLVSALCNLYQRSIVTTYPNARWSSDMKYLFAHSRVARNLQWVGGWGQRKGSHLKLKRFLHQNSSSDQKKNGLYLESGVLCPNSTKGSAKITLRSTFP